MKSKRTVIALLVFTITGMAIFTQILIRQEEKAVRRDIQSKGNQIVSLIALHSIHDFEGDKRNFFIRTLMEYTSNQGLIYCFITDQHRKPIVSLNLGNLEAKIPNYVQTKSLAAMGLIHQPSENIVSGTRIFEFTKPIFEKDKITGSVRIGLKSPAISIISMERINLLAVLLFFIISAVTIVYYGFVKALKPLEQFSGNILNADDNSAINLNNSSKSFRIGPMMEEFQKSMIQFKNRLEIVETYNKELSSRVGVLKFEKNQVMNIINSINFGVIITDIQDNVNHINDYMLKLLNKVRRDVIDTPLEEVLKHEEIVSFISQREGLEDSKTCSHLDTSFPGLAHDQTFRISCCYLLDDDKELLGKMIMFNNITREQEAKRMTREFTAHLSHELITPLTTIKSYSEMLMEGEVKDSETQKEFYNAINNETNRLSRLIKNLLNLSKIELGSMTLDKDLVRSDWFFEDCVEAVQGAAQQKNIFIQKHVPDNFPSFMGDKDQLKVAFINVLNNAIKYSPTNSEIHFSLREENNMLIFDIKDSGYGISKEDISHIFDKLYRSSNPKVAENQGTGLGLAITSEIIGLHNGEIKVQSELDIGSHFTIKIPKEEFYLGKQ
jgi:signal transduction histidine kinase